jgi:hypothetical protein
MHKLEDIIVWRTNDGAITITSALENKRIATILNHRIDWNCKEDCSAEVIAWIEEHA